MLEPCIVMVAVTLMLTNIIFMKEIKRNITLSWIEKTLNNTERIGAVYCFKRCNIDQL